jgi:hypothetical protein
MKRLHFCPKVYTPAIMKKANSSVELALKYTYDTLKPFLKGSFSLKPSVCAVEA